MSPDGAPMQAHAASCQSSLHCMSCWGPLLLRPALLTRALCRDKDGRFSLNDILDMLELGRARARLHQVQTLHASA